MSFKFENGEISNWSSLSLYIWQNTNTSLGKGPQTIYLVGPKLLVPHTLRHLILIQGLNQSISPGTIQVKPCCHLQPGEQNVECQGSPANW